MINKISHSRFLSMVVDSKTNKCRDFYNLSSLSCSAIEIAS